MGRIGIQGLDYIVIGAGSTGVDSQLPVHGIAGLRVADTSMMTTITNGNFNAPGLMIGERAAERIATATNIDIHTFGTK